MPTDTINQGIELRNRWHPGCVVCSPLNPRGLGLRFHEQPDNRVRAEFNLDAFSEGYQGLPHGGILTAILDGAMVNWLFAHDITALTLELQVQFRHTIQLEKRALVEAWLKESSSPIYVLQAHILQDGKCKTIGTGKFVCHPDSDAHTKE
jgi:acyl-coenzyme A thioesterase PaaI-like protein